MISAEVLPISMEVNTTDVETIETTPTSMDVDIVIAEAAPISQVSEIVTSIAAFPEVTSTETAPRDSGVNDTTPIGKEVSPAVLDTMPVPADATPTIPSMPTANNSILDNAPLEPV